MEAKRIVVVGATSGIGLDVARLFISRGWFVGVAGRNTQMLDALKQENPSQVYTAVIDITHSDAPERLSHLIEEMSGMDVYFHSSGIGYNNPQLDETKELDTPPYQWRRIYPNDRCRLPLFSPSEKGSNSSHQFGSSNKRNGIRSCLLRHQTLPNALSPIHTPIGHDRQPTPDRYGDSSRICRYPPTTRR